MVDPSGLAPGDPFDSQDEAAKDAYDEFKRNCPSNGDKKTCENKNVEWATVIFKRADGKYVYKQWRTDGRNSSVVQEGLGMPDAVAGVHSHPRTCTDARCKGADLNNLSPPDYKIAAVNAKDSYLVTQDGSLKVFDVYADWRPGNFGGDHRMAGELRTLVKASKHQAPALAPRPVPVERAK